MSGLTPAARRLSAAWFALALVVLGLSALFAVVLVVARTPFLGQGAGLFRTALVLHVDLAVVAWFLSVAAAAWSLNAGQSAAVLRWSAFVVAAGGALAMVAAPVAGGVRPILSNYVPVLDHPLFLAGLGAFAVAIVVTGVLTLLRRRLPLPDALSIAALLIAAGLLTYSMVGADLSREGIGLDDRFWGAGHTLQFVHILLMMKAWSLLGSDAIRQLPRFAHLQPVLFAATFLPVLAGPLIAFAYPLGTDAHRVFFTQLMRWGSWPSTALFGALLAAGLLRLKTQRALSAEERGLSLSLFLFGAGCVVGAFIRGESLAVPAHYHATVGAVTLAYLLWMLRLAPVLGAAPADLERTRNLPLVYGFGISVLVAALAVAGQLGIPRKAPHIDLSIDGAGYFVAMGMAGIGGFLALSAVVLLVFFGLRAAYRGMRSEVGSDARFLAVATTLVLVLVGGALIQLVPGATNSAAFSPGRHAEEKIRADIDARFQQGVLMLHAKQYEHALTAFHRVLQLAPEMPEAYVNMGFALLGMQRYKEASDFFESATMLRKTQVNAYYGLAVALEGTGDLRGALGAMETYLHLSKPDDPFRRKAEAAIWEWRAALDGATPPQPPAAK